MLTKKQLEYAARCGKTKCTECLNRSTCCASGMKVAVHDLGQTALAYREMLEEITETLDAVTDLIDESDTWGNINTQSVLDTLKKAQDLLKEGST